VTAFLFYVFAALAVAGGLTLILHRNPVYSALSLIVTMFSLAALFAMLDAQFLAIIQVLVYAGAVMVLFLFVIMLINVRLEQRLPQRFTGQTAVAVALSAILLVEIIQVALTAPRALGSVAGNLTAKEVGRVQTLAGLLFTKYVLPFEVATILLLVAIVGGIYLAKRKIR